MKQTAVEWLTEKLRNEFGFAFSNNIFEQAKEMEKEQTIEFAEWAIDYSFNQSYSHDLKDLLQEFKNKQHETY